MGAQPMGQSSAGMGANAYLDSTLPALPGRNRAASKLRRKTETSLHGSIVWRNLDCHEPDLLESVTPASSANLSLRGDIRSMRSICCQKNRPMGRRAGYIASHFWRESGCATLGGMCHAAGIRCEPPRTARISSGTDDRKRNPSMEKPKDSRPLLCRYCYEL